jgi:cytochrome bd-type quinol oxidase subunit 1
MEGVFSAAFIMAANSWPQNPVLRAASASSTPRWKIG